jgi:hypothetical protein
LEHLTSRFPVIYQAYASEKGLKASDSHANTGAEEEIKILQKQQSSVLQSARQIFSIAINCLQ